VVSFSGEGGLSSIKGSWSLGKGHDLQGLAGLQVAGRDRLLLFGQVDHR
jgi:hypothetical protein